MKRLVILLVLFGIVIGVVASTTRFVTLEGAPNFGYTPPSPEEQREYLYGDHPEDLKSQAPELFPQ
jgi:hypothetical protein